MNTWSEGFLTQAKQDFATIQAVIDRREKNIKGTQGKKLSSNYNPEPLGASLCMLFQMFFEKYSKACFCAWSGDMHPGKKHKSVDFFIQCIKRSQNKDDYNPLCCKLMQKLERLQTSIANASKSIDTCPQLEYPWQDTSVKSSAKIIRTPATDLDIALKFDDNSSNDLNLLLQFASFLLNNYNKITSNKIINEKASTTKPHG